MVSELGIRYSAWSGEGSGTSFVFLPDGSFSEARTVSTGSGGSGRRERKEFSADASTTKKIFDGVQDFLRNNADKIRSMVKQKEVLAEEIKEIESSGPSERESLIKRLKEHLVSVSEIYGSAGRFRGCYTLYGFDFGSPYITQCLVAEERDEFAFGEIAKLISLVDEYIESEKQRGES
ncbi:MAG: hypothetical protein Q7R70_01910 [Candidatus Diapherotrites archaeon]|nr:hypothetical protein [Candidatus Diapherotrites archaeon]